jgi:hypothetical protein
MKMLIVLIIFSIFIVGCGDVGTNYFPLSVGNIWTYSRTITDIDSTINPDSIWTFTDTQIVEITAKTELDDGTDVFEILITTSTYIETLYYEETSDYIGYYYDKAQEGYYYTELDLPIEEGKTWIAYTSIFHMMITAVVLGKDAVQVSAGNYDDCWEIRYIQYPGSGDTTFVYYAEDIGKVKSLLINHYYKGVMTTLIELKSATIK